MKRKIKILLLAGLSIICFAALGQDTTVTEVPGTGENPIESIWEKIIGHLEIAIPALLMIIEAIVRIFPTVKDYSIVNKILGALQWIMDKFLPNKSANGGTIPNKAVIKATTSGTTAENKNVAIQAVTSTPTKTES